MLEKEMKLRTSLEKDGLKPRIGCLLARYNDPGRTWSFMLVCMILLILQCFHGEVVSRRLFKFLTSLARD